MLHVTKVEEKSSTTFSNSLFPGFLSFLRGKFSPLSYGKFQKLGAKYFSLSPDFLSFLREKFSFFSSTLHMHSKKTQTIIVKREPRYNNI
jgi:hypothetical protein